MNNKLLSYKRINENKKLIETARYHDLSKHNNLDSTYKGT